jgi:hypothetical protein
MEGMETIVLGDNRGAENGAEIEEEWRMEQEWRRTIMKVA